MTVDITVAVRVIIDDLLAVAIVSAQGARVAAANIEVVAIERSQRGPPASVIGLPSHVLVAAMMANVGRDCTKLKTVNREIIRQCGRDEGCGGRKDLDDGECEAHFGIAVNCKYACALGGECFLRETTERFDLGGNRWRR